MLGEQFGGSFPDVAYSQPVKQALQRGLLGSLQPVDYPGGRFLTEPDGVGNPRKFCDFQAEQVGWPADEPSFD